MSEYTNMMKSYQSYDAGEEKRLSMTSNEKLNEDKEIIAERYPNRGAEQLHLFSLSACEIDH